MRSILTGKPVYCTKYKKMRFGSYGQAIHKTNLMNTTMPRTLGVINLRWLDTLSGGFEVMNLLTGNLISRRKVTLIPITQEFIDGIEALANKYSIESPLKFKNLKEWTICKDDRKNDDENDLIEGVDDEDEGEYEPNK